MPEEFFTAMVDCPCCGMPDAYEISLDASGRVVEFIIGSDCLCMLSDPYANTDLIRSAVKRAAEEQFKAGETTRLELDPDMGEPFNPEYTDEDF